MRIGRSKLLLNRATGLINGPQAWSIVGGLGNAYAGACFSTLLVRRTPDSARGRVSAAANAAIGGAQGASLLIGGAVAVVVSPRAIYAIAGILGVTAATTIAVLHGIRTTKAGRLVIAPVENAPSS